MTYILQRNAPSSSSKMNFLRVLSVLLVVVLVVMDSFTEAAPSLFGFDSDRSDSGDLSVSNEHSQEDLYDNFAIGGNSIDPGVIDLQHLYLR